VILDVAADWNLLSVPMAVPDPSRAAVFPSALGRAYGYAGGYVTAETLAAGAGYWLKFPAGEFLPIAGDSLTAETLAVAKGWNLLGSLSAPLPAAAVATDPPGIISTPFYAYDGSYSADDTLRPGRGYWVKTTAAGAVVIDAGATPAAGAIQAIGTPRDASGAPSGTLTVADARGRSVTLRLSARGMIGADSPELPPLPPAGAFDVRFGSRHPGLPDGAAGMDGAGTTSEEVGLPILTQGVAWPVVISWNIPGGASYVLANGPGGVRVSRDARGIIELAGSGSIEIASAASLSIRRASTGDAPLPSSMSLDQNFPNPFNPSTRIRFTVGTGGSNDAGTGDDGAVAVTLRVYDVAGRAVATLAAGAMAPGPHELDWNAGDLPGGVYFCVLKSGRESRTTKMLLLK